MKYPVIYIKGRGNHTARFTELTEGQMRIAGDIGAAMGKLMPLKDDHAFILYEQQGEEDIRSIRFLRLRIFFRARGSKQPRQRAAASSRRYVCEL